MGKRMNLYFKFVARAWMALAFIGIELSVFAQTEPSSTPDEVWVNRSILNEAPHVNAVVVENYSEMEITTPAETPFFFFNTQYFTNNGTIRLNSDFDYRNYKTKISDTTDYTPVKAKVFYNMPSGLIERNTDSKTSGKVAIESEYIINRGLITTDNAGVLTFKGDHVDLRRGGIEIKSGRDYDHPDGLDDNGEPLSWGINLNSVFGSKNAYQSRRLFTGGGAGGTVISDWGVRDTHWGIATGMGLGASAPVSLSGSSGISFETSYRLNFVEMTSPYQLFTIWEGAKNWHLANRKDPPYGEYIYWNGGLGADGFTAHVNTDFTVIGDNEYHQTYQAILVRQTGSDNVKFDVKMNPRVWNLSGDINPERFYSGPIVEIKTVNGVTNVIAGARDHRSVYIIDEMANVEYGQNSLMTNSVIVASKPTWMPENFVVTRYTPQEFVYGASPNGQFSPWPFLYGEQNSVTINDAVYGFRFTNIVARAEKGELPVPDLEELDIMLQPGRVEIDAENLDLRDARIRAEGGVSIKTRNLIGSEGAVIDSQNLSLDLANKTGLLVITNMVPETVERFAGGVKNYSVVWANNYKVTGMNPDDLAAETTISLHYHLLVVDAFIQTDIPVRVNDLTVESDQVIIKDPMWITDSLRVKAERLSLFRDLQLGKKTYVGAEEFSKNLGQYNWNKDVAPTLSYFTNYATLNIPAHAHFGDDRDEPYSSWVNYGTNRAKDVFIHTKNFQTYGLIESEATTEIDAHNAVLQDGQIITGQSLLIKATNFKMTSQTNLVAANMSLDVSDILTDGGGGAGNVIQAERGIELKRKPKIGDLLGTEIRLSVADFQSQRIPWPAEDRGVHLSGYRNNAAVGKMILSNGTLSKFVFGGLEGQKSAIYIDYLEFKGLKEEQIGENSLEVLEIEDGYTVYFADSNVPSEEIDGLYDGRLRWVKEYPGSNSSMPLYLIGLDKTILVNRAFRQSIQFDTDDDGTANGFDLTPFGGGLPDITAVTRTDTKHVTVEWMGIPGSLYRIEYKDNVEQSNWELLKETFYDGLMVKRITHRDQFSRNTNHRFYRVVFVE